MFCGRERLGRQGYFELLGIAVVAWCITAILARKNEWFFSRFTFIVGAIAIAAIMVKLLGRTIGVIVVFAIVLILVILNKSRRL